MVVADIKGMSGEYALRVSLKETLAIGTIVVIPGIKRINRAIQYTPKGKLTEQNFVVTREARVGDTVVSLYPAIISKGRWKTVSRLPRNGDKLSLFQSAAA